MSGSFPPAIIIRDQLGEHLVNGATVSNPGPTVMKKLFEVLTNNRPGAKERSEKAKSRKRGGGPTD